MKTQPVALSSQLAPKQVMRVKFESEDLAVWRSTNGVAAAWENRCPHRGMRLSHGFVRGESLACAYHGWHYDCSGQCHNIPAHPELKPPSTVRVNSYSIKEQSGIVWVNTEEDAQPVSLPDNLQAVRSLTFNCNLEQAITALSTIPLSVEPAVSLSNTTVSDNPKLVSFSTPDQTNAICIAFQQQHQQSVVCHVLAASTMTSAELITVSRWCEAARRHAEELQRQSSFEQVSTE